MFSKDNFSTRDKYPDPILDHKTHNYIEDKLPISPQTKSNQYIPSLNTIPSAKNIQGIDSKISHII